MKDIMKDNVKS